MEELLLNLEKMGPTIIGYSAGAIVGVLALVFLLKSFILVCPPNHILILSGRKRTMPDGSVIGFRVIKGGWAFRWPILESAEWLEMSNISVPMNVEGAYSLGNIPLSVQAVANIKVSSDDRYVRNAIERFLGHGRGEIARVAKETLEGHLRGVLAMMTPEQVNEDRLTFSEALTEEAERDLEKLGLHLDTLNIQHVSDQGEYLDSIGRKRVAEVLSLVDIAESDAGRAAKESEAAAAARGMVAKTNAEAVVAQRENELRQVRADLSAAARSEEERAVAAAQAARAEAEKELQTIRGELEELRLAADITIPAEAERRVRELIAAGQAATIAADGQAMATALDEVAQAWNESDGQAMDMYIMQNLEEIFGKVTAAAQNLKVREVNLIDSGDGQTLPAYISSYPATVGALLAQIRDTLGVDIGEILNGDDVNDGGNTGGSSSSLSSSGGRGISSGALPSAVSSHSNPVNPNQPVSASAPDATRGGKSW